MGNPCADYEYYREYVVATLPQLRELDMREIERSERIKALQVYARARDDVIAAYRCYERSRLARQARRRRDATHEITEINETVSPPVDDAWYASEQCRVASCRVGDSIPELVCNLQHGIDFRPVIIRAILEHATGVHLRKLYVELAPYLVTFLRFV